MIITVKPLVFLLAVGITGCNGAPPAQLGVHDGNLSPCPDSPNCVSSQSTDPQHRIEPFTYLGSQAEARDSIVQIIQTMERTRIITNIDAYVYTEFRTRLGFVDDVEFLFDDSTKTIHIRSASRVGYSDLGLNRARIEAIREIYLPDID